MFHFHSQPFDSRPMPSRKHAKLRRRVVRPAMEPMEPRLLFSTYQVTSLADVASSASNYNGTLRWAVQQADTHAGSNTIDFATNVTGTITLTQGALNLTNTSGITSINGPGKSSLALNGAGSTRIFQIAANVSAVINAVTVTNGRAPASTSAAIGGGIDNAGILTLVASSITGNTANAAPSNNYVSAKGGGIYSSGTLTLENTSVTSNSAIGYGPEKGGYGGGIFSKGSLTLTGSTISSNTAGAQQSGGGKGVGGGVDAAGSLSATSTTFSGNTARGANGGVQNNGGPGGAGEGGALFTTATATLNDVSISGNIAQGDTGYYSSNGAGFGGGVFNDGTLTISGSTLTKNQCISGNNGGDPAQGGGIDNADSLTLEKTTVSGNSALGGVGLSNSVAGSDALGGGVATTGTLTATQCTITDNTATGGVGNIGSGGESTVTGAGGDALGGGLYVDGSTTLTNSTVDGNFAVGGAGGAGAFETTNGGGTGGNASGGGVYAAATLNVTGSTLSGNTTTSGAGGAGYESVPAGERGLSEGAGLFVAHGTTTLNDAIVSTNMPALNGGGIYNAATLTLIGSSVTGNVANPANANPYLTSYNNAKGGGIYSSGTLTLENTSVTSNTAHGYGSGKSGYGGGIFSKGSLTITGSTISSNTANGTDSIPDVQNFVEGNGFGGGVESTGPLSVTSTTFSDNSAQGGSAESQTDGTPAGGNAEGGALFTKATSTLTNVTISGNSAEGGTGYYGGNGAGWGGGVFNTGTLTISASTLTKNHCNTGVNENGIDGQSFPDQQARGGAIDNTGHLTLEQTTVSGNMAVGGVGSIGAVGGAALGGGIFTTGPLTVTQSTLSTNTARGGVGSDANAVPIYPAAPGGNALGGGIYVEGATTITNSTIADNSAIAGAGGATGAGSTAGANGGNADGGGVYTAATLTVFDSTVSGNATTAGAGGAGYYANPPFLPAGKPGVAGGAGLFVALATTTIDNTIVSANKAGSAFSDIGGAVATTSSDNLIGIGGGLSNGAHGNKTGVTNPKLSALGNYGGLTETLLPLAGSPAIDAGSNALIPSGLKTDQRGYDRIFNTTVDIGADEYNAITITGFVFNDLNGDGVRQTGEPGLPNWQVYVDIGDKGVIEPGDPSAMTNASGNYSLVYSPPAGATSVIIREARPSNYRRTEPAGIYPLGFYSIPTNKAAAPNIDFGDSMTTLVEGTVFHDTNGNGKQDSGEAGLAGWVVEVDAEINGVWQDNKFKTTTASDGSYSIVLTPGTYRFHDVLQSGLHSTVPSTGSITLTLADGATDTAENFGNR